MSTQKNEHNPDGLPEMEEFRFLCIGEEFRSGDEYWDRGAQRWLDSWNHKLTDHPTLSETDFTYRRRITPPTDTTGSGREGETDAFLTMALTEQIEQARKWKEHYTADPKGQIDKAFWDGKERAYSECLNLVQSNSTAREPSTPSKGETPETDAEACPFEDLPSEPCEDSDEIVPADFARQLERRLNEEKRRRINYQTIVYDVCNLLDKANGKKPGNGIVCGTEDSPTKQTQEAVTRLIAERDAAMNDLQYRDESTEANRKCVEKCNHLPSLVIQSENGPICCECARVAALAQVEALRRDGEIVEWLRTMHVEVREPLVHGSRPLFRASPDDDDGIEVPSDLREKCRAAIDSAQRQEGA